MNPDRAAFLKAIEAAPWDDELPRLVYADWLDEHDEPEEATRQRQMVPSMRWLREYAVKHKPYDASCGRCHGSGKDWHSWEPGTEPGVCRWCNGSGLPDVPDPARAAYDALVTEWNEGTIYYHGDDLHRRSDLEDEAELRHHMAIVTGRTVSESEFSNFTFTCSC